VLPQLRNGYIGCGVVPGVFSSAGCRFDSCRA
jgi:hypothetical protein